MSISSTNRKSGPYIGNGITTALPFSFKVFSASDVLVVRTDLLEAETNLALTTHYTVALNADQDSNPGGTVNLLSPAAAGYLTTITSAVPDLQSLTLTNAGGFYPKVINDALDRLTIMVQQLAEKVSRSLKVSISSSLDPASVIASIFSAEATATAAAASAEISAALAANSAAGTLPVADQIHGADSKVAPAGLDEICIADSAASYAIKKLTISSLMDLVWSSLGGLIGSGTGKAAPVDADYIPLMDSSASGATKSLSWGNLKSSLKAYFDTVYIAVSQASASEINNESPVAKYISPDRLGSSKRAAKAWVNFDGTLTGTITPRASLNVTSVTKSATGTYVANLTTAMADANYAVCGSSNGNAGTISNNMISQSTTSFSFQTFSGAGGLYDGTIVACAIFGN